MSTCFTSFIFSVGNDTVSVVATLSAFDCLKCNGDGYRENEKNQPIFYSIVATAWAYDSLYRTCRWSEHLYNYYTHTQTHIHIERRISTEECCLSPPYPIFVFRTLGPSSSDGQNKNLFFSFRLAFRPSVSFDLVVPFKKWQLIFQRQEDNRVCGTVSNKTTVAFNDV